MYQFTALGMTNAPLVGQDWDWRACRELFFPLSPPLFFFFVLREKNIKTELVVTNATGALMGHVHSSASLLPVRPQSVSTEQGAAVMERVCWLKGPCANLGSVIQQPAEKLLSSRCFCFLIFTMGIIILAPHPWHVAGDESIFILRPPPATLASVASLPSL